MLCAAGCSSDKPAEKKAGGPEEKVLTVYSARSEQLNNAVIPQFEKDTGIKVNLVVAGTGEVLKRAKSEKPLASSVLTIITVGSAKAGVKTPALFLKPSIILSFSKIYSIRL